MKVHSGKTSHDSRIKDAFWRMCRYVGDELVRGIVRSEAEAIDTVFNHNGNINWSRLLPSNANSR